jgi:uncharacterized membrane-anchored protein
MVCIPTWLMAIGIVSACLLALVLGVSFWLLSQFVSVVEQVESDRGGGQAYIDRP